MFNDIQYIEMNINAQQSILKEEEEKYLKEIVPYFEKNYKWYLKTQRGNMKNAFRWRGRTNDHTLPSGLDDFPRGTLEPLNSERHLDLYCWMYMMAESLYKLTSLLNISNSEIYKAKMNSLKNSFDGKF